MNDDHNDSKGLLTPEQDSLVLAIAQVLSDRDKAAKEESKSDLRVFKGIVRAKDIVMAVVFFASLLYGAVVTFTKLESKPDLPEVTAAIEERVSPLEDLSQSNNESIEAIKEDVVDINKKVDRQGLVLEYVMESQSWQSRVLQHIANKSPGKSPSRPESLSRREQELISQ
jgi:hypothetical protein